MSFEAILFEIFNQVEFDFFFHKRYIMFNLQIDIIFANYFKQISETCSVLISSDIASINILPYRVTFRYFRFSIKLCCLFVMIDSWLPRQNQHNGFATSMICAGPDPCWSQTHYVGFVMTRLNYWLISSLQQLHMMVLFVTFIDVMLDSIFIKR
jgi:hypothetical protein